MKINKKYIKVWRNNKELNSFDELGLGHKFVSSLITTQKTLEALEAPKYKNIIDDSDREWNETIVKGHFSNTTIKVFDKPYTPTAREERIMEFFQKRELEKRTDYWLPRPLGLHAFGSMIDKVKKIVSIEMMDMLEEGEL